VKDIKTKKVRKINGKTMLVALDIAQEKHTGYLRCPDGTEIKPFEFSNNHQGFDHLWERIYRTMKTKNLEDVVVGIESTGSYAEPVLHYLMRKPVKLVQVNPLHTKRLKELHGNSPNKTDYKDPQVIADIIELGHSLTVVIPEGASAELRRLTQARERALERRTAALNQLQGLICVIFPEFLQVVKDIKTKTSYHLLKHFPSPQDIVKLGVEALRETIRKTSRGRLGKEHAEALYEAARRSVGIQEGLASMLLEIRQLVAVVEEAERSIAEFEDRMRYHLKEIPYSRFLLSIQGIGEITIAGLIGEVGDFRKFKTAPEIIKLAGLDLFEVSSGKHKGQRHISKRGRSLMRKLLFFAAINVIHKGRCMHERYQRYLQRGMPRIKALIAVARKLLSILFALVRDHSEYVSNYEDIRIKKVA
jgi:transposase